MREYYHRVVKHKLDIPAKSRARMRARYWLTESQRCSVEGCDRKGERHHKSYDRPLDIVWLCRGHHHDIHKVVRLCGVVGCVKPHRARGLCNAHWVAWFRSGKPVDTLNAKIDKLIGGKDE